MGSAGGGGEGLPEWDEDEGEGGGHNDASKGEEHERQVPLQVRLREHHIVTDPREDVQ